MPGRTVLLYYLRQSISCFLLISACALAVNSCANDTRKNAADSFHLNLSPPRISDRTVTINGGVVAPVERIQWDWGDGTLIHHHFFPATHTYSTPGTYTVTVTVYNQKGRSAAKTAMVTVK